MKVTLKPGKYVLAVSGGIDSMTLLDLLSKKTGVELVVAHFNHGIRADAHKDEQLVMKAATAYKLDYEAGTGNLGSNASEDTARQARYRFLEAIRRKYQAEAIITAHHQDDKIETAFINLLRGTGRQGISAISDNEKVLRPLLNISKGAITAYARKNNLRWREDSTNQDTDYLRNYLRLMVLPKLSQSEKLELISNIDKVAKTNKNINQYIATLSRNINPDNIIDRQLFADLPSDIGCELVVYWLRSAGSGEFDKKTVQRLAMAIKTAKAGTTHPIKRHNYMKVGEKSALFSNTLQKQPAGLV